MPTEPRMEDPGAQAPAQSWADLDLGWTMAIELVAGTFTWGGIGWLLDRWLDTGPWVMVVGFLVGFATGFYILYARSTGIIKPPSGRDQGLRG